MSDVSCLNSTLPRCGYASSTSAAVGGADEIGLEAGPRRRGSGTDPFNSARSSRRMFPGGTYLDRAAPRLAPAKFLLPIFTAGLFIEPAPGSNCPGRILSSCPSALASRFPVFRAAFAFARWRALALVMSSSPFKGVSGLRRLCPKGLSIRRPRRLWLPINFGSAMCPPAGFAVHQRPCRARARSRSSRANPRRRRSARHRGRLAMHCLSSEARVHTPVRQGAPWAPVVSPGQREPRPRCAARRGSSTAGRRTSSVARRPDATRIPREPRREPVNGGRRCPDSSSR